MPIVSVLIPVYNAASLIERCLISVFSQQHNGDIEAICVDDGSTDNSVEVINSYKQRTGNNVILLTQQNSGPSAARNKALKEAEGEFVAYLDADDYWMPGFIKQTVSFLSNHNECVAVTVGQRHITTTGDSIAPYILTTQSDLKECVLDDFYDFWSKNNHVCTGSILIRREVAQATGGQREDLRVCEDLEFWALLASYGKFGFIPQVLFVSDGGKVIEEQGWVAKHIKRWQTASTIEEWENRLAKRFENGLPEGLQLMKGRIGKSLVMSILYSKRKTLAYEQIKKHYQEYPQDIFGKLFSLSAKSKLIWILVSNLLIFREHHR